MKTRVHLVNEWSLWRLFNKNAWQIKLPGNHEQGHCKGVKRTGVADMRSHKKAAHFKFEANRC
jgi:hypothetical protein